MSVARDDYVLINRTSSGKVAPCGGTCTHARCAHKREVQRALDEIDRLRAWKAEATAVIDRWDALWDYLGCPGVLGEFKPTGVLREIDRLRANQVTPAASADRVADVLWAAVAPILGGARVADVWDDAANALATAGLLVTPADRAVLDATEAWAVEDFETNAYIVHDSAKYRLRRAVAARREAGAAAIPEAAGDDT